MDPGLRSAAHRAQAVRYGVDGRVSLQSSIRLRSWKYHAPSSLTNWFSTLEHVGDLAAFAVHVDRKASVNSKKGLLAFAVAAISAVGAGVEQLADCEAVGGLHG